MQTEKYIRKVKPVDAVQVTEDNLTQVAGWCGGLVVPPGGLGQSNTQPYIHVHVRNPRTDADSQAFPGTWIIREDFRFFRILTAKQFKNTHELYRNGTSAAKKSTSPSPASVAKKAAEKTQTSSGSSEATPKPTQVGAIAVTPGTPSGVGPQPIQNSAPTEGAVNQKENISMNDSNPTEQNDLSAGTDQYEDASSPVTDQSTPDVSQDAAQQPVAAQGDDVPPLAPQVATQSGEGVSSTSDDVLHADATDAGTSMNADELSGEARNVSQSESDADGTVQLGQPASGDADAAVHADEDVASEESPALCGQCGSPVVDGVCSNDINHNVNGQAGGEDTSSPRILPGS